MFDALDALKGIEDEEARAREISKFLRAYGPKIKELSDIRRAYVMAQRGQKISVRALAAKLAVSASTIQDIERGYSGSGKTRPRKAKDEDDGGSDRG
ncbi:hypothetical protein ACFT54_09850 [Streptomyces cinereoruber]|uniref:hypothetical protein n=1 Tax=Streptomyces cinereoruber TaxID=67260 RepID=UPI0036314171